MTLLIFGICFPQFSPKLTQHNLSLFGLQVHQGNSQVLKTGLFSVGFLPAKLRKKTQLLIQILIPWPFQLKKFNQFTCSFVIRRFGCNSVD